MYSYEDRLRAIELYIEYGKMAAATVAALGYPSTKQLKRWYQIFKYSAQQRIKLLIVTCAQANLFRLMLERLDIRVNRCYDAGLKTPQAT